ncbi:DUF6037 family protein [Bacillus velezensis]|uniref:DUF6037 family protein n=1 Tax=Bacillus velezensis TaxID=492670 RepID=UPI0021E57AD4|nr:DUF6037 family protein [Bacillus velezensis]MCV2521956.1 DUF6037 family protein [Bacillus velezensis]MEC0384395.1 DUF6037 family protein [Bacillus velezensis]MEC3923467.1 DUF6037 family protein [Bacillus velezensis]
MQLNNLKFLYKDMKRKNIDRSKFDIRFKSAHFKCIFLIDKSPFKLILAARGVNFYLEFEVKEGYNINSYIEKEKYYRLCEILGIKKDDNNKFSTNAFLNLVNDRVPHNISNENRVVPADIAPYRKIVEEENKVYFYKWIPHDGIKSNVSHENLEKTRLLIGEEAYLTCKERNISSGWTDNPKYADKLPREIPKN